jgi:uncharacterized membrane protein YgcG
MMYFNEPVTVNASSTVFAYVADGNGVQVASLTGAATGNAVTLNSTHTFTSSTTYYVIVPYSYVRDTYGNNFTGTQLSGCYKWSFTTADSNAPAIVNTPAPVGAYCNNTLEPGQTPVYPTVDQTLVLASTSNISFRFCHSVTSSGLGLITIKKTSTQTTVAGVDLSTNTTGIVAMSTTLESNDTVKMDFAANALDYDTHYTVSIPANTFQSSTNVSNAAYSWGFTTMSKPNPIIIESLFPANHGDYNDSQVTSMIIGHNDTIASLGTEGKIYLYRDSHNGNGYERVLSVDVASPNQLTYYTTSSSRRSLGSKPQRRTTTTAAGTYSCSGSCITGLGTKIITVPIPSSLNVINPGDNFQGSVDQGALKGVYGQAGPGVFAANWEFLTNTGSTNAFNNPTALAATGGGGGGVGNGGVGGSGGGEGGAGGGGAGVGRGCTCGVA